MDTGLCGGEEELPLLPDICLHHHAAGSHGICSLLGAIVGSKQQWERWLRDVNCAGASRPCAHLLHLFGLLVPLTLDSTSTCISFIQLNHWLMTRRVSKPLTLWSYSMVNNSALHEAFQRVQLSTDKHKKPFVQKALGG